MFSEPAIRATRIGKCYQLYARPQDRLKQFLWRSKRKYFREFWALRDVSFEVMPGEVVGIIGRNGSGKSTLLQLVCGTLNPSAGEVSVRGRVAALLELGAGFNPEFTGRENVFMSATIMGLSQAEIAARFEEIVEFSGIRDFIDQPVKTYSSGMYVRLAFSVAINVDPDILVIDEALSVGDGAFSRRSFERVMRLKEAGKTILFCSHSLYQVEVLCQRAIWIEGGIVRSDGNPAEVVSAYEAFLKMIEPPGFVSPSSVPPVTAKRSIPVGFARIEKLVISADGVNGTELEIVSRETQLRIEMFFSSDPSLPTPSLAVMFLSENGDTVASAGSHNDSYTLRRDASGRGCGVVTFPALSLLKGTYYLAAALACEQALHFYEIVERAAILKVRQHGFEHGVVSLPHTWETP